MEWKHGSQNSNQVCHRLLVRFSQEDNLRWWLKWRQFFEQWEVTQETKAVRKGCIVISAACISYVQLCQSPKRNSTKLTSQNYSTQVPRELGYFYANTWESLVEGCPRVTVAYCLGRKSPQAQSCRLVTRGHLLCMNVQGIRVELMTAFAPGSKACGVSRTPLCSAPLVPSHGRLLGTFPHPPL